MLDKLKAGDFKKAVGKHGSIVFVDGPDAQVEFLEVSEHKECAMPDAPKGARTPFSVLLRCDQPLGLSECACHDLIMPDGSRVEGVAIAQITSHPNPNGPADETLSHDMRILQIVFT
ncbi:MAG: hypothetical protein RIB45_11335 [Marivibrio sp.]|uniref:hypothetical protein n=1 Tax=Marivibrio sp. TaxID=2039719 RepID=UPI0032ED456D